MISVAIDGPSGAGKSSIARLAAKKLGFVYVDTGAIYRSVGLCVKRRGIRPGDAEAVAALLEEIRIDIEYDGGGEQHMLLCGEDVSEEIRMPEVSLYASEVSAIPRVREFLLEMQREMARRFNVIMDGRDIGTVVLPGADVKIFLTASPEKRAARRLAELRAKGVETDYEQVLGDMKRRDDNDSGRKTAPLRAAEDAIRFDNTDGTLEENTERLVGIITGRLGRK